MQAPPVLSPAQVILKSPVDAHVHLRDGDMLKLVLPYTASSFKHAIIMPNLTPPITTVALAERYYQRIMGLLPPDHPFDPKIALYLTDHTTLEDVTQASNSGIIAGFKLYPAGATTNSDSGVTDINALFNLFNKMEHLEIPLMVHAEVTDPTTDIFDRERLFIERYLVAWTDKFPDLKIVLEHATTAEAVNFVLSKGPNVVATITPHHLLCNRNNIFNGGIQPHFYCLPVLKREKHRLALVEAATSGDPKFFAGTDSAPHDRLKKEAPCGCAGIFCAPVAIPAYVELFEEEDALPHLQAFMSDNARTFYNLFSVSSDPQVSLPTEVIVEDRSNHPQTVPAYLPEKGYHETDLQVMPFLAGAQVKWHVRDVNV